MVFRFLLTRQVSGETCRVRIQPPLTISEENLRKSYAIIDQAITDYENGMIPDDVLAYRNGW